MGLYSQIRAVSYYSNYYSTHCSIWRRQPGGNFNGLVTERGTIVQIHHLFKKSAIAASILLATACGDSGSLVSNTDTAATSNKVVGVITGFGSIYVNGVKYETDSASVSIDGVNSLETSLGVGDVITLEGTINPDGTTGVATAVSCNDEVEGYVLDTSSLLADGTGSINVMGQTIVVTVDTVFDGDILASINDVSLLDIVEVSGFPDGTGNIVATRIESKNAAEDVEVKGTVAALDETQKTFKLGELTVDYSSAAEVPANLSNGSFVEVKTETTLSGDLTNGFVLSASKVETEDNDSDIDGDEGEEITMQGVVSGVDDAGFSFNGTRFEFSSIDIDDDFDVTTLVDGATITVEGYIDANGNFIVEEIEDEHESENEDEGLVTAVTESTITISVSANVEKTFSVNNNTRMIDEQDEGVTPLHYFSLADVSVGDYVEIESFVDDSAINIATELKREDEPSS